MDVTASALRTGYADPATTSATTGSAAASSDTNLSTDFDKDTFLKLLVAQLKYQDPTNPTDMTQFMSQTAQFTMVEKVQEMTALTETLLTSNQTQAALSLVGREVSYKDSASNPATGIVDSVALAGGVATLRIDELDVSMDQVIQVRPAETAISTL